MKGPDSDDLRLYACFLRSMALAQTDPERVKAYIAQAEEVEQAADQMEARKHGDA